MTQWEKQNELQKKAQRKADSAKDDKIRTFLINAVVGFEIKKSKLTLEQAEMLV